MSYSDKLLNLINRHCLERFRKVESGLFKNHANVVAERKYLVLGSTERGCYTAGYLQALRDLRELIHAGEFPGGAQLEDDGGPRIPRKDNGTTLPGV